MLKTVTSSLVIILALLFTSCDSGRPYTQYEFLMDTSCAITVYTSRDQSTVNGAFELLRSIDSALDRFDRRSEVYAINENAGKQPVKVSEDTYSLIKRAKELSVLSTGAFNPLLGRLSLLWNFTGDNAQVPDEADIQALLVDTDIENLVLDDDEQTVYLASENITLDLGGIAKGYASQMVADYLRSKGVKDAIINLGGNIYCIGPSDGSSWTVGIQDPYQETGAYFTTVPCIDEAVVTSGGYQRYFEEDGRTYHHILDPKTGWPAESDLASATIIDSDGALADAFSTAFFVLGSQKAFALAEELGLKAILLTVSGDVIRLDCQEGQIAIA